MLRYLNLRELLVTRGLTPLRSVFSASFQVPQRIYFTRAFSEITPPVRAGRTEPAAKLVTSPTEFLYFPGIPCF